MEPHSHAEDHPGVHDAKASLRQTARTARQSLSPEARRTASHAIAERALELPELSGATAVLVYGASPEEADPAALEQALRKRGVRIGYPRVAGACTLGLHWVDGADLLTTGAFGLIEPTADAPAASLAEITAIIVPGVAFDGSCNRLGFGGGFYDQLLGSSASLPPTIGLAFDEQIVAEVPCDGHDRPVDIVVTPTRTLRRATRSL
jgi:5-formyltetrahydrofolate cyclo-ligase